MHSMLIERSFDEILANIQNSNGKLICYYSDQRANTTHGQKLVHQVSTDLKHWGPVVDDVYVLIHF